MSILLQWRGSLGELPKYEERDQFLISIESEGSKDLEPALASTSVKVPG